MEKITIGSRSYVLHKMDVFKQFHVARKMAPMLAEVLPHIKSLKSLPTSPQEVSKLSDEEKFQALVPLAGPIIKCFSSLSNEDADFVLHNLLECVEVDQGKVVSKLMINGTLMFNDLELPQLLNIAARVFMSNLSGFFNALPQ